MEPGLRGQDDVRRGPGLVLPTRAAMEPAAERRDDAVHHVGDVGVQLAAMEPASERRDDFVWTGREMKRYPVPQWSPPLSSGNT